MRLVIKNKGDILLDTDLYLFLLSNFSYQKYFLPLKNCDVYLDGKEVIQPVECENDN